MRVLALILTAGALASPLAAQGDLHPGDYVRLRTRAEPGRLVEGRLESVSADRLIVQYPDPLRTRANGFPVVLADTVDQGILESLEVRRTRGNRATRGLVIGAGTGVILGIALGLAAKGEDNGFYDFDSTDIVNAGLSLGLVGGVVGVIAGAATKVHVWEPVPGNNAPLVGLERTGFRVGWQARF